MWKTHATYSSLTESIIYLVLTTTIGTSRRGCSMLSRKIEEHWHRWPLSWIVRCTIQLFAIRSQLIFFRLQFADVNAFLTLAATRHTLVAEDLPGKSRINDIIAAAKAGRVPVHLVSSSSISHLQYIAYSSAFRSIWEEPNRDFASWCIANCPPCNLLTWSSPKYVIVGSPSLNNRLTFHSFGSVFQWPGWIHWHSLWSQYPCLV